MQSIRSNFGLLMAGSYGLITSVVLYLSFKSFRPVDPERWAMIVKDTGVGIESHEIGRAFEEFQRIEPREDIRGTGLGLAITKRLVELLGGHIKVQSEVNRGSRFEVIFPLKKM